MKIIQLFPYYPPHLGGAEQRIKELSECLARKGHQVEVFTSDIDCPEDIQLKSKKNLKINYLQSKKFINTPILSKFKKMLMDIPNDSIIHLHAIDPFMLPISYLVAKIKKIPLVFHIRGDPNSRGKKDLLFHVYKKIVLENVLKKSKKIIALNEDYKTFFVENYHINPKLIKVIPNATNFKIISKPRKIKKLKNLLFIGRLSVEKNIDKIMEALSILHDKNLKLFIAGEGEKKEELSNLVKTLKLEKNIFFLGNLDRKQLYQQYLKSDVVILPSEYECFSSVLLEAMATGTPIIASNIPGTRCIIKNNYNGLLVKPTSEEIAKAIAKLIKNPKLKEQLTKNGLKEIKKYSWDKVVKQTEEVYREVLKEHNEKQKTKSKTNS